MAIRFQLKWRSQEKGAHGIKTAEVLVSNEDGYLLRNGAAWFVGNRCIKRSVGYGSLGRQEFLPRLIMRAENNQTVFHINGDYLDCRRSNLVVVDESERSKYTRALVEAV